MLMLSGMSLTPCKLGQNAPVLQATHLRLTFTHSHLRLTFTHSLNNLGQEAKRNLPAPAGSLIHSWPSQQRWVSVPSPEESEDEGRRCMFTFSFKRRADLPEKQIP